MPRKNKPKTPRQTQSTPHLASTPYMVCRDKRQFGDENSAARAIDIHALQQPNLELRSYKCPYCQKWHLTRAGEN